MDIDARRLDRAVPEGLLHKADWRTVIECVRGMGMSEPVRGDALLHVIRQRGTGSYFFDDRPCCLWRHGLSRPVGRATARRGAGFEHRTGCGSLTEGPEPLANSGREQDLALLSALANKAGDLRLTVLAVDNTIPRQRDEFGNAEATKVSDLKHQPVALIGGRVQQQPGCRLRNDAAGSIRRHGSKLEELAEVHPEVGAGTQHPCPEVVFRTLHSNALCWLVLSDGH